jgi:hypothetical protein
MKRRVVRPQERIELSQRIRSVRPRDWDEFSKLWTSFNTLYDGENDRLEIARIRGCLERHLNDAAADYLLRTCTTSIAHTIAIPPGDMRLEDRDPGFRKRTIELAHIVEDGARRSPVRVGALGGVLYQIRNNLTHGDKDPLDDRDQMLVAESNLILRELLPLLDEALGRTGAST